MSSGASPGDDTTFERRLIGQHEIAEAPDRIFHSTATGTLRRRVVDFSVLPSRYPELDIHQVLKDGHPDPLVKDLSALINLGLKTWREVEAAGMYPFPDTPEKLYKILTNPGARVALLEIVNKIGVGEHLSLEGGVVVHKGQKNMMVTLPPELAARDRSDASVPATYRELPSRPAQHFAPTGSSTLDLPIDEHGIRLWVTDDARELGPRGTALDYLMSDVLENLGGGRIGTRVVMGPAEIAHVPNQITYRRYGFERTGLTVDEEGTFRGQAVTVTYEWWVYPPFSEKGRAAFQETLAVQAERDRASASRIASMAANLPVKGGVVAHIGPNSGDGFDLAAAVPGDTVFNLQSSPQPSKRLPEPRGNLYHYQQSSGPLALPAVDLDTVVLSHAVRDVLSRGEGLSSFVQRAIGALGEGSSRMHRIQIIEDEQVIPRRELEALLTSNGMRLLESRSALSPRGQAIAEVAAEKVRDGVGVEIRAGTPRELEAPRFIGLRAFRHTETGEVLEIASRPGQTIDLGIFTPDAVMIQQGRPRPHIVNPDRQILDRSRPNPYPIEQLAAVRDITDLEASARSVMRQDYGIETEGTRFGTPLFYMPLPMDDAELVAVQPAEIPAVYDPIEIVKSSNLDSRGVIRPVDPDRLLQACLNGSVTDDRVARIIYARALERGDRIPPSVIKVQMSEQGDSADLPIVDFSTAFKPREGRRVFEEIPLPEGDRYYDLKTCTYREYDRDYREIGAFDFEYVTPSPKAMIQVGDRNLHVSNNSVVVVPFIKTDQGIFILVGRRDSPAAQEHSMRILGYQSSEFTGLPDFLLPDTVISEQDAVEFGAMRLEQKFNVKTLSHTQLGKSLMGSPGANLQSLLAVAVELDKASVKSGTLVSLDDCLDRFRDPDKLIERRYIMNGGTLTGIFRFAHAVGAL